MLERGAMCAVYIITEPELHLVRFPLLGQMARVTILQSLLEPCQVTLPITFSMNPSQLTLDPQQ
jgi:hypothetical protein